MEKIEIDDILKQIQEFDVKDYYEKVSSENFDSDSSFLKIYKESIETKTKNMAVLGIDIYQYSQFDEEKQVYIPILFRMLFQETICWCKHDEPVVFNNCDLDHISFIDTGDGGFIIFDTPLQALTFNLKFYTLLKTYNTGHFYPKLHHYIGEITLRSCITYNSVYQINSNYYGTAIIHNARILSKDKLNRFIIDADTDQWFNTNIGGLDRLKFFTLSELFDSELIQKNFLPDIKQTNSLYHDFTRSYKTQVFENVHIQKIESIAVKKNVLPAYNVEIQINSTVCDEVKRDESIRFVVTIGNLNTTGLSN